MITRRSSLVDVAFDVCTALDAHGVGAILTGGSAATYYTDTYRSRDVDFVIAFGSGRADIEPILREIGFRREGSHFAHPSSAITLDFPPGPLGIGTDLVSQWETVKRDDKVLHVLSRTDSVRDRLAGFYYWNDRSNFRIALAVARSGAIDLDLIRDWSKREGALEKLREFERVLKENA